MKLLIIEPHASGHHASYLRWILEGCQARDIQVLLATTRAAREHPLLQRILASDTPGLRIFEFDLPTLRTGSRLAVYRNQLTYRAAFGRWTREIQSREAHINGVLLPYLEYCIHGIAALGSPFGALAWSGITMRLSALAAERRARGKWWLVRRLLQQPSLQKLYCINPSIGTPAARGLAGDYHEKLCYLRDPAEQRGRVDRSTARLRLGLARNQVALLVFGALTERKGIRELISALRTDWPEPLRLILAGRQSAEIRTLFQDPAFSREIASGRIIVRDFIHDDTDEATVYAASDIGWLGYMGHPFMSGVLVAAGRAGLPVITSRHGEMGYLTRTYDLGITVDPVDTGAVHAAVCRLLQPWVRQAHAAATRACFARHTPQEFADTLLARASDSSARTPLRATPY